MTDPGALPDESRRRRRAAGVLALVALALALQGARPLWDPDEGRYVDVALEMMRTGDWLTPLLHHEVPHYSKPPLVYWALASSMSLFGRNEWSARLPNSLAFVVAALLVGRMARRLAPGSEEAATVVYATSLLPFLAASVITSDTQLAAAETAAMAGFVELVFGDGSPRSARALLWGGFGLAFLAKGPPGLLPLVALLIFAVLDGRSWQGARRLASFPALALFAVLALTWYLEEIARHPGLLHYLVGSEVVGRVQSAEFRRNAGALGALRVYLPTALLAMLPWWPLAWLRARRAARAEAPRDRSGRVERLLWLWLLVPFAIFCLAQSRLPLYLLPLAAPAALLVARRLGPDAFARRGARLVLGTTVIALLALRAIAAAWPSPRDGARLARELAVRLPDPVDEVLFVEARPRYSLAFYLDCEVEQIDLASVQLVDPLPAYRPLAEPLAAELAAPEHRRALLVAEGARDAFGRELATLGYTSTQVGPVGGYVLYRRLERIRSESPLPP